MDSNDAFNLVMDHLPQVLLILAGLTAIFVALSYHKDKDSYKYKIAVAVGFILGAAIGFVAAYKYSTWHTIDIALIGIAAFALIIRPFRKTDIALLFAVFGMAYAYIMLGSATGNLEALSQGIPRIVATVVIGAIIYMILGFIQRLAQLVGTVLNFWPLLIVLGVICIIEGALVACGYPTLLDYYNTYIVDTGVLDNLPNPNL